MTRRTRRRLLFGLPASLAVALITAWLFWPPTAITRENAAKVQVGMTLAEVEAVLGGPARDESTGPLVTPGGEDPRGLPFLLWWRSNHVMAFIRFDADWRVTSTCCIPRRAQESLLDRLRRWLGL